MTDPITPPPELVAQWDSEAVAAEMPEQLYIATMAARWGADQELEACVELWANNSIKWTSSQLRDDRRPKPPSLKEQALAALQEAAYMADDSPPQGICTDQIDTIRRALEALPE